MDKFITKTDYKTTFNIQTSYLVNTNRMIYIYIYIMTKDTIFFQERKHEK